MNATETRTTEDRIRDIVPFIAGMEGSEFASLKTVRAALADIPRAELDATLVRLYREQKVNLITGAAPWIRAEIGEENAVRCGGEYKYRVCWH